MLTKCYSPACSDLYPCYTYTCPRWGQVESKSRLTHFQSLAPLRITNMEDDDVGSVRIQYKLPSRPARVFVDAKVEEGDIFDRYWELIDEMDGAFGSDFQVGGFSEEVTRKVESIMHPGRAQADRRWLLLWTLLSFISLWFLHTLFIVPFTLL
ncbi:hypothetical protein BDZ89DRAFT_25328 [Hymenopellis radicata]|nr:hypothetical protein BDZ89DRAFT_25328 [Hymenopellis radicata]